VIPAILQGVPRARRRGDDFAHLLAIERTTGSVAGSEPTSSVLRSTTIFRVDGDAGAAEGRN
jgi:hypothetical protein